MVRFRQVEGTGFDRESWEIEVLQMGADVRVRGSVRTGGNAIPIYRPMDAAEFRELWQWLRAFPLDRYQVRVDETAPEAPWTKSLEVDVVLGPEERWISRNTWTRPLLPDDWVRGVEARLHGLVLDLAEAEMDRLRAQPPAGGVPPPGPLGGGLPGSGLPGGTPPGGPAVGSPGDEAPLSPGEAQEILRRAREAIGATGDPGAGGASSGGGSSGGGGDPGDSGE
jgi:uncharacterized membrane protein YgcG